MLNWRSLTSIKIPRTASPVGSPKAAVKFGWMAFMLTTCIWKETGREGGPDLPPQSHLLTVRYLHRVSASVHRVLWAVGSGATPVEVQLDGVVNIWKAAASHRHAAPNLEDDWKPQNPTLIQKQQAFRGLWDPNLCVCTRMSVVLEDPVSCLDLLEALQV